jgi:competence protein ComFC
MFKFRGDAILADGFEKELKKTYSRIIDHRLRFRFLNLRRGGEYEAIVPIPLSRERLVERGFNQAELLARKLGQPIVDALIREKNEQKQSKKNRRERLLMRETPFHLKDDHVRIVTGKKILLVDDLYTTGATMRLAATAFTPAHPKQIDSLTLIHG